MKEPKVCVVLVGIKSSGNIGSVARVMKNFGFSDLRLVGSASYNNDTYMMAMHAKDVLESAKRYDSLDAAVKGTNFVVATSARFSTRDKDFLRHAIVPRELGELIAMHDAKFAVLFGREDYGLTLEEIKKADFLVTVPGNKEYPVLNISHAVAIILYEIFMATDGNIVLEDRRKGIPLSSTAERAILLRTVSDLMKVIGFPPHKHERTKIMIKKMIARAMLTKWEYHRLMGLLQKTIKAVNERHN